MEKSLKQRVHHYSSNDYVDDDEDFELCSEIEEDETQLAKYRCEFLSLAFIFMRHIAACCTISGFQ